MKSKLKFDSNQLKAWLAAHAEKLLFGGALLLLLNMAWGAFSTPSYPEDKAPGNLKKRIASVQEQIEEQGWNRDQQPGIPPIPNPPYADQIRNGMVPVDPQSYAFALPFNNPMRDNKVRREDPSYYPAREVLANYGRGAIRNKGQGYVGQQWIAVTALVPYGAQAAEYDRLFLNSLLPDPVKDKPTYVDYVIERRSGPNAPWEQLDKDALIADARDTFAAMPDIVAGKYLEARLTQPLLPLADGSFDGSVAHPPEIPLAAGDSQSPEPPVAPTPGPPANLPGGSGSATPSVAADTPPFRLLRFFDRSVQSNNSYQYRVKLILANPNHNVPTRYLQSPNLATAATKETAWSSPSPLVRIGGDYRVLAGSTRLPGGINEALVSVIISKWDLQQGTLVSQTFDALKRGSMLQFRSTPSSVRIPGSEGKVRSATVDYLPESLIVDVTGGEVLLGPNNRPIRAPAEMLFLDNVGELSMRGQIIDSGMVHSLESMGRGAAEPVETPATTDTPSILNFGNDGLKN